MGQVVPGRLARPGREGRQRIKRRRNRQVADGVEVQLEPLRPEPLGRRRQHLGLDEQPPGMTGGDPGTVQVRRGHRGGERLAHAVQHELDRGRPERPVPGGLAPRQHVVDLRQAAVTIPPQRADHVAAEHPVVGRPLVGAERVRHPQLARRAHAGVLVVRDAQRVQV